MLFFFFLLLCCARIVALVHASSSLSHSWFPANSHSRFPANSHSQFPANSYDMYSLLIERGYMEVHLHQVHLTFIENQMFSPENSTARHGVKTDRDKKKKKTKRVDTLALRQVPCVLGVRGLQIAGIPINQSTNRNFLFTTPPVGVVSYVFCL